MSSLSPGFAVPMGVVTNLCMAGVVARWSKNPVNGPRWYFCFQLSGFISLFYAFAMPRWIFGPSLFNTG